MTKIDKMKDGRPARMAVEAVGERLIRIRTAFGLQASEFADGLDVSRSHWSKYEKGARRIPLDQAEKIYLKYGVSLDYIYLGRLEGLSYTHVKMFEEAYKQA